MRAPKVSEKTEYHPWRLRAAMLLFLTALLTLFAGGVVTSKNVGLAVPDWPTSYGYHLWNMPFSMWRGGVFYEHAHRVVAGLAGCLTLGLTLWLGVGERRAWVRRMALACLGLVVVQGIFGGLTVLFGLPTLISVLHGITAQVFLGMTALLCYALSRGRCERREAGDPEGDACLYRRVLLLLALIVVQLVVAAYMRHDIKHQGGVAIPDFPTMTGRWLPRFDQAAVEWVQAWRRDAVLEHDARLETQWPIRASQMVVHFLHRLVALLIAGVCVWVTLAARRRYRQDEGPLWTMYGVATLVVAEIGLGIMVVWSMKGELITSLHVLFGALILVGTVRLAAQTRPLALPLGGEGGGAHA